MTYSQDATARALPERPNLEHLKNEAKQRLEQLRLTEPDAQLSDAQFKLAREYGFSSWRDLKAKIEAPPTTIDPTGDWISQVAKSRFALHVRKDANGAYRATTDSPDTSQYGKMTDDFQVQGDALSFSQLDFGLLCEAHWDASRQAWVGDWRQNGLDWPLVLTRGVFPPNSVVIGLDGLWDGILQNPTEDEKRFSFAIRTDEHGTAGMFHSPDTNIRRAPLRAISRDGQIVTLRMKTFTVTGPLSEAGDVIDGEFQRGDWTAPLVLTRRRPGAAPPQRTLPPDIELPVEAQARFAGTYQFSQGRQLKVWLQDGRLFSEYDGGPAIALTPIRETEFRYPVGESGFGFIVGDDGEVEGVQIMLGHFRDRGDRLA